MSDVTGGGDVYTMAEAARLKGVSYHTVSRAVRRGKLPATRLGRMALITSEDLREWHPMRERAPRKYRRREPNPEATPALLDLASAERVELASRLATLYEALHAAATMTPQEDFFALLADRLAGTLRVGTYGPPLSTLPDETPISESPFSQVVTQTPKSAVIEDLSGRAALGGTTNNVTSLLIVPIRSGNRTFGVIVADKNGERFQLNQGELDFAQSMANVAALELEAFAPQRQTAGAA